MGDGGGDSDGGADGDGGGEGDGGEGDGDGDGGGGGVGSFLGNEIFIALITFRISFAVPSPVSSPAHSSPATSLLAVNRIEPESPSCMNFLPGSGSTSI